MVFAPVIATLPALGTLLILLPIIVALYLLAFRRWSADKTGIVAFALGFVIAVLCFGTNPLLAVFASIAGIIASFPISLMVVTSILMITYMARTGGLARITVFFKTLGSGNKAIQIMLINVGLGLFLVGLGATPLSMLPPVMLAMGFSPLVSVMSRIEIDCWKSFSEKAFKLNSLSLAEDVIFPVDNPTVTLDNYRQQWEEFTGEFRRIGKFYQPADFTTIYYLLRKYTAFMPSATPWEPRKEKRTVPDISLFEQAVERRKDE